MSINFRPKDPYKLCDLKPFYGIIHQAELQDYDFWGFGDIDLIYGDLNIIVNQRNLEKYDFITTHGGRIGGHFTIVKRNSRYSELCKRIKRWEEKLIDERNHMLDEVDYAYVVYPQLKNIARIYHYAIRPFGIDEGLFFNVANKIFCNKLSKRLFQEYYTTPRPTISDEWLYNIDVGAIKKSGGGFIPYLHFLLFKKNAYFRFDGQWSGKYYFINDLYNNENNRRNISISLGGIMFK